MGDKERDHNDMAKRGESLEGGYSILLDDESIRTFMDSGDFSSARELDHFRDLGALVEGRLQEGKSHSILALSVGKNRISRDFTVLQLAHILAKHGRRVLIIDCDFISPGLSGLVDNMEDYGFLDLLLYGSSLKSVMKPTGIDGVSVTGTGSFPVSRTIPFAKKEFTKIRDFLGRNGDVLIYCSTFHTDDGQINPLAGLVDGVLLSCRIEEMPEGQLQKNLKELGSGLPPADLVCFGESKGAGPEEQVSVPAHDGAESSTSFTDDEMDQQETETEDEPGPAFIEKTEELECEDEEGGDGVNLPRIVTVVVVVIVVVFLSWWFIIHRSIREKEGSSKMNELVQKQRDAREKVSKKQPGTVVEDEDSSGTQSAQVGEMEEKPQPKEDIREPVAEESTKSEEQPEDEIVDERVEPDIPVSPEIDTPVTTTPAPEGSHFAVHVASFKDIQRAGTETDYLEKKGFITEIVEVLVKDQTWYRVMVGEYETREEALAARVKILSLSRVGYTMIVTVKDK